MASCMRHAPVKTVKNLLKTQVFSVQIPSGGLGGRHGYHTRLLCVRRPGRTVVGTRGGVFMREPAVPPSWLCYTYGGIRNNSTAGDLPGGGIGQQIYPDGYIPEPPPVPMPSPVEQAVEQLNALGEPAISSLGLGGYAPPGMVQTALEWLHVSADLPWWGAIVAGTLCLRILMFPLVVLSQRNAANMSNHMPTVQQLQAKFTKARASGNPMEAARAGTELMEYMKRNKVNPMKNMIVPLAQLPIFLSVFVGVRQMANLPVVSMQTGGLWWFTDLTIADPFYALPLLTSATFLLTIELGTDGIKAGTMTPMMKYFLRAMPVFMLPVIINFPTAMLCYWFTSNAFSMCQVLLMKIPALRKALKIPQVVKHEKSALAKKKSFREGFKESMDNARLASKMQDRERMDAIRFKEAATGPLQKTYPYDPTKVKTVKKS